MRRCFFSTVGAMNLAVKIWVLAGVSCLIAANEPPRIVVSGENRESQLYLSLTAM
jgi:hypothetical protein